MPSPAQKHKTHKPSVFAKFLALLPTSCVLLYPLYLAAQLDTVKCDYVSDQLPKPFDGLTVTYISDIHYGSFFSEERVRSLVEKVNALNSDLILLGGDYGEDSEGALNFWNLKPAFRASMGVFAIMGNHDRTPPERNMNRIMEAMRQSLAIPLVNDVWQIEKEGSSFAIAGTDDFYNGRPDLKQVAEKAKNAHFTLLLAHSPDQLPDIYERGKPFFNLALCGHTHGGQVTLFHRPLHGSSLYGNRYVSGWYREEGVDILVSNGVGTTFLPVRLGARPQIHQITLRCQSVKDSEKPISQEEI